MKTTIRPLLCFAAVFAISGLAALHAGESYVLAKKNFVPPAGSVLERENTFSIKDAPMEISAGGQKMKGVMNQSEKSVETLEVVSPAKLKLTLAAKRTVGKMLINGQEQKQPEKEDPLLGKTVVLDLVDGKWTAALDGGEPGAEQKKALEKKAAEANRDSGYNIYGDKPRKPGDEWKVDPAKTGIGDAEDVTGDFTVKFLEVKETESGKCAILQFTFDFKGKTGEEGQKMDMSFKGEALATRSLEILEDIEVKLKGTLTIQGEPSPGMSMKVEGPMEGAQTIKAVKK